MAVTQRDGSWPHTKWIDLKNNGVMVECAVLKEDGYGNVYFIEIPSLDAIDKNRIARILAKPRVAELPLWESMGQSQLKNGMNALDNFHQLTKIITPEGVIMNPRVGAIGTGKVDMVVAPNPAGNAVQTLNEDQDTRTPSEKRNDTIAARKAEEKNK